MESSAPLWLVKKLIEAYGFDTAKQMLTYREASHPTTVRPNLLKLDDHGFEDLLRKKNLSFRARRGSPCLSAGGRDRAGL